MGLRGAQERPITSHFSSMDLPSAPASLLAGLGFLGEQEEAGRVLGECLDQQPDFSVSMIRDGHLYTDAAALNHYLEGLRKAGVAE